MKRMRPLIGSLVVIFFLQAMFPVGALAAWDDRSDELDGSSDATPYLIAGGVLVAAAVVYLVLKHKKDDAKEEKSAEPAEESSKETGSVEPADPRTQLDLLLCMTAPQPERGRPLLGPADGTGWRVGLRLGF